MGGTRSNWCMLPLHIDPGSLLLSWYTFSLSLCFPLKGLQQLASRKLFSGYNRLRNAQGFDFRLWSPWSSECDAGKSDKIHPDSLRCSNFRCPQEDRTTVVLWATMLASVHLWTLMGEFSPHGKWHLTKTPPTGPYAKNKMLWGTFLYIDLHSITAPPPGRREKDCKLESVDNFKKTVFWIYMADAPMNSQPL